MALETQTQTQTQRVAEHDVAPLFVNRWSPRAMSGEPISREDLLTLLEAARWTPSSFNNQPWRLIYAHRDTPAWRKLFDLLIEVNQTWCKQAAALLLIVSKKTFDNGKPSSTHSFDTGAAWMSVALHGFLRGYVVHGMEGFDYEAARAVFSIPDDYQVEAMAAIGRPGKKEDLPEALQAREFPSDRKPLRQMAFEGFFPAA